MVRISGRSGTSPGGGLQHALRGAPASRDHGPVEEQSDGTEIPRFAHSIFGYDRYQVEEYLGRLQEWAAEAHDRADEAERRALELEEQLEARQSAATQRAEGPSADQTGDRIGARAREEADEILRAAREIAERMVAEAERREADGLRGQAEELRRQKAEMVPREVDSVDRGTVVEGALSELSEELTRVLGRLEQLEHDLAEPAP